MREKAVVLAQIIIDRFSVSHDIVIALLYRCPERQKWKMIAKNLLTH